MKRRIVIELVSMSTTALLAVGCGASSSASTSVGGAGGSGGAASTSTSSTSSTGGAGGAVEPSPGVQTQHPLGSTTAPFGFYDYLPPGYNDGKSRPLMVFFHGIGENGNGTTDLPSVLKNGPPKLIDRSKWPADRPFVVISSQWDGNNTCPSADFIHSVISWSVASYHIDAKRVYLTGLSCGAIGGWSYLGKYVDVEVAAAVLISGAGKGAFNQQGCALTRTAIWAFHGDMDPTVSPGDDELVMPKLIACPQPRRDQQFTLYPGVGHDAWSQTFDLSAGHDVYAWLLANPKP